MRWTVLSGGAALLAAAGLLSACAGSMGGTASNSVAMEPISFAEIPGWADDKQAEALAAFRRSCPRLESSADTRISTDGDRKSVV